MTPANEHHLRRMKVGWLVKLPLPLFFFGKVYTDVYELKQIKIIQNIHSNSKVTCLFTGLGDFILHHVENIMNILVTSKLILSNIQFSFINPPQRWVPTGHIGPPTNSRWKPTGPQLPEGYLMRPTAYFAAGSYHKNKVPGRRSTSEITTCQIAGYIVIFLRAALFLLVFFDWNPGLLHKNLKSST